MLSFKGQFKNFDEIYRILLLTHSYTIQILGLFLHIDFISITRNVDLAQSVGNTQRYLWIFHENNIHFHIHSQQQIICIIFIFFSSRLGLWILILFIFIKDLFSVLKFNNNSKTTVWRIFLQLLYLSSLESYKRFWYLIHNQTDILHLEGCVTQNDLKKLIRTIKIWI